VSSYINPDFGMANACFNSLLQTAIKANFLRLPFSYYAVINCLTGFIVFTGIKAAHK
jgi:hypothetical protein